MKLKHRLLVPVCAVLMATGLFLLSRQSPSDRDEAPLISSGFVEATGPREDHDQELPSVEAAMVRSEEEPVSRPLKPDATLQGLDLSDPAVARALASSPPSMEGAGEDLIRRSNVVILPPSLMASSDATPGAAN